MNFQRRKVIPLCLLAAMLPAWPSWARPILTEPVEPLGFLMFEAAASIASRQDEFGSSPSNTYKTAHAPMTFKLGIQPRIDLGLTSQYISHSLNQDDLTLKGSMSADFVAHIKYSPSPYWGFMALYYQEEGEKTRDELPIGHGHDFELLALFKLPMDTLSVYFNSGYVWKGPYTSQMGIVGGPHNNIRPGDIFENRLSIEIPLVRKLNFLAESAYYLVQSEKVNGRTVQDTSGDTLDILGGLTWSHAGWNLGLGLGTSVLNESHTSFDLMRGMGDRYLRFYVAYQLKPKRPDR